ncbi:MAG TPA: prepilin-type N-terminal cleavage/methylation domain-containing protein, partial [Candidatus Ozemobacteraceae bacterium]|nr:prepilin-type N-terminal cleavage/methylation domain-containing protein [Candidatus Ozemobacteraceae bacterium]
MRTSRDAFSLIEVLMAIMVFSIACLPLYQLYFKTGISQQRMIRDFIAVTNVAEKIVNRIDHQLEKKPKLLSPMQKDVTPQILVGMEDEEDWNFLGKAFAD